MAVSARNQLTGKISAVATGAVNDEVELTLENGAKLVAVVTHSSKEALGLANGKEAIALIKAPWVTLATEDCGLKFSARNQFAGSVNYVSEGAVNATVTITADAGFEIVAVITNESREEMQLNQGSRVIALIKASAILIATRA
ncbi:MAG: TOBE domain-containing protein [Yokenella regensburgei]|jgi:molybdate transport system regulatory protein|uniref:Molybdate transport system regulatory protein n=1 Tax=Yokenella regensburgei TaxID=158877 RepID=A0AB38FT05_9ENTR|nr:TOBE domain-containing protein [Yokenella regensburgei]EHM49050.1 TOBE domain protein [Yokenella regensburgei ATCC 43003]KAF1370322.1 molybdate transport system regulatory protein [Yokenella regensburgei]KFD23435.1 ModE family molybdate-binding protein [Yokenella regensburgei ATCC 49455]MDQ4430359.1 TOBE domain-containing protein [Yokenella regensburgei]MDR3103869.1 TOBE domain-containing protein [Yokenella regensburgei]